MAAAAAGVGRLEEEALRRKERLKALREKTGRKPLWACLLVSKGCPVLRSMGARAAHSGVGSVTLCVLERVAPECPILDKEDGEPKIKQLREEEEEGEKHRCQSRKTQKHGLAAASGLARGHRDVWSKPDAGLYTRFRAESCRDEELRLRNYVPEDEDLKRRRVPQAKPVAVEEKVKEQLEAAKPEPVIEEVDLANLAPRKPDWDLKRDVAKKLEKLEKRTQRAIAELIRERLKGQEDSLASAVDASAEQEACDSD
ncbi:Coiled-coil domain-containing protein 12 [Heterocephalus glaber]|uniref:Coiled-coil domain-containing protein 12 n=1 Tax=Heterocephalus glaber TaxID=10181 RepID=G5ANQ6_HETGA|nr:Coiled-coil domain-containing protein 12 [Heterocephalus glaber]